MKHLKCILLILLNSLIMNAQQHINLQDLGLNYTIPTGWASQVDGDYMFLKHNDISGLMVIFESRSKSVADLLNLASNGITDEGVELRSLDDFRLTNENTVEGHYQGIYKDSIVKAFAIGVINGLGSGISILALSEPNHFNDNLKSEARKLIDSVKFEKVKPSKKTRFWKDRLVGNRLKYFNTRTSNDFNGVISTGISDSETLELFNDNSFYYLVNNQSFVNSGTLGKGEGSSGDYRIVTLGDYTYLQLFFKGDSQEFELSVTESNNTLLNGRRYLVVSLED